MEILKSCVIVYKKYSVQAKYDILRQVWRFIKDV